MGKAVNKTLQEMGKNRGKWGSRRAGNGEAEKRRNGEKQLGGRRR
jgi:hypothetical protein